MDRAHLVPQVLQWCVVQLRPAPHLHLRDCSDSEAHPLVLPSVVLASVLLSCDCRRTAPSWPSGFRDNSNKGAVWTYTYSASTWTEQKIVNLGSGTSLGLSLDVSKDANTMAIGDHPTASL
jgi:hypothetical protein